MSEEVIETFCENCGCPDHPCMPCGEVVMLYGNRTDSRYFGLLNLILKEGRVKKNRTGIDTIGVFGAQEKFDVDLNAFPILTTKRVFFKGIVHELLWFIKGDTNIKYLVDNGVHIWDEWAYKRYTIEYKKKFIDTGVHNAFTKGYCAETKQWILYTQDEFIQKIKDCPPFQNNPDGSNNWEDARFAIEWGELGEGTYGGMWRAFPYYESAAIDPQVGYVDQLVKVVEKLKSNPDDRRMIVSAWHPYWVDHCALPPCHTLFHFNTEELTHEERCELASAHIGDAKAWEINPADLDRLGIAKRKVNLLLYQRSCDTFLGVPFNITSYALLLAMVAHCVGMEPGVFTHTYGDLHIYSNHKEQIQTQLSRTPRRLPKLWLNPSVRDLFAFTYDDIKLEGYNPHPAIKADVAV